MHYRQTETAHLKSIARSMKELLSDYDTGSGAYREYQRSTLTMMCRWLEKFIIPHVSESAEVEAKSIGIDAKALRTVKWSQQVRKLKDPGRKKFHFEHFVTVKDLTDQVIRFRNQSVNEIAALLLSADIAWITKCEDKKLTKNKFGSHRPNPQTAYNACGIKFVEFGS